MVDETLESGSLGGHQNPLEITGGHRMSVDNATIIKADAARCISLGMAAMLILCLSAFRRRWLAIAAFLLPETKGKILSA